MTQKQWSLAFCLFAIVGVPAGGSAASYALGAIAGTGSISGTVATTQPLKAAQVYAKNLDKSMLYMVYTSAGRYQAVNLMPGNYEVWAEKQVPGPETENVAIVWSPTMGPTKAGRKVRSETKKVTIAAGTALKVDLALSERGTAAGGQAIASPGQTATEETVKLVSYDQLYPPGPGKDLAERKCMGCHMQDFFPGQRKTAQQWDAAIGIMLDPNAGRGPFLQEAGSSGTISAHERHILAEYLAAHFGPKSPPRALKVDIEYLLDEQTLSKAMFVEYLMPAPHRPQDPHLGPDGNIWFTNRLPGVSRLDPITAEFKHFPYPDAKIFGHGLTVDSKGYVYWAEFNGYHLGRLDPKTGKMDRFPMDPTGKVRNGQGHTPVLDSKEDIFFTDIGGNNIGKWDRKTEKIKLYRVPTNNSFPYGELIDKNDKVWFAELHGCKVGQFDPVTEKFKEYPSLAQPCKMRRLGIDSKGTIWYGVTSAGKLGKLDPKTGKQVEYDVLPFQPKDSKVIASEPYDVVADHGDQIWFGDDGLGGALIKFNPQTEKFTYYPLPRQTDNPRLDLTRDGGIVYTTRSNPQGAIGILFPDVSKMTTYAAYR